MANKDAKPMPPAVLATRPNVRSTVSEAVLNRWNPDLVYNRESESAGGDDNTISIMDEIGSSFWSEGVTAKRIKGALRKIGNDNPVTVNINSPGGDVFEGLAIYNLLNNHGGHVTVNVIGLAASAAADIAMAGDTINIGRAAFMMIHNTWTVAWGDQHALRETADWLVNFDAVLADIFHARTGIAKAELTKMLDAETWLSGEAAIEQGFADGLLEADRVSADTASNKQAAKVANQIDRMMAKFGVPRSERRRQIKALKGDTPGAIPNRMPGATDRGTAAINRKLDELLSKTKTQA